MSAGLKTGIEIVALLSCIVAAHAQAPKTDEGRPGRPAVIGVVGSVDTQGNVFELRTLKTGSDGSSAEQVRKVKWTNRTKFRSQTMGTPPASASDLKRGADVIVQMQVASGGTLFAANIVFVPPQAVHLTEEECRHLGCVVQFNVNCPRRDGALSRAQCKCSGGAACITD